MDYSLLNAIAAQMSGTWGNLPSFESQASNALLDKRGGASSVGRALAPTSIFKRATPLLASGNTLVPANTDGFFSSLQAMTVVGKLGAQYLPLDTNTLKTPVVETTSAPVWQTAEGVIVPEAALTLGLRTWVPHDLPISVVISGQLLKQGKNAERYLLTEILRQGAAAIDWAAIQGDGAAGRPRGIINTTGVTTASGTGLNYTGLVAGTQAVSDANAVLNPDSLGFVASPTIGGILKQRAGATASLPIWRGQLASGSIDEAPAYSTKNCPAGDLIFGDFSNLIIASWGDAVAFDVDPFTGFQSNLVTLRLWLTLDIQLRSPAGFTVFTGVT